MTSSPGVASVRLTRQGHGPSAIFLNAPCAASSASESAKRCENCPASRPRMRKFMGDLHCKIMLKPYGCEARIDTRFPHPISDNGAAPRQIGLSTYGPKQT